MDVREIEVKEDKTVAELMNELGVLSANMLLEVNGEICYPDDEKDRKIKKGDRITLTPLLAGG